MSRAPFAERENQWTLDHERQMLRDTFALVPHPGVLLMVLPNRVKAALAATTRRGVFWEANEAQAAILRPHGLCEFGGRNLTVYGTEVRAAMARDAVGNHSISIEGCSQ